MKMAQDGMSKGATSDEVEKVVVRGKEEALGEIIYSLEADCLCAFVRLTGATIVLSQ